MRTGGPFPTSGPLETGQWIVISGRSAPGSPPFTT
jgi:hypothetical protein